MSSVINKCVALISLRVAGASGISVGAVEMEAPCPSSSGDGDPKRGEVAFEQMLSLSAWWRPP